MTIQAARLAGQIDEILEKHGVPGAAVAITRNGETEFRHLRGVMSVDTGRPVTERSTFDIGSITKTFNTACLALLVDEGKVRWTDRAIDHLPGWRLSDPTVTHHVQVADLVGQSLGLGEDNVTNYHTRFTRQQIIDQIRYLPLRVPFRSECTYQSYGPVSAGAIVERLSGRSWEEFVEERIAGALGLGETFASFFRMPDRAIACDPHFTRPDGNTIAIPHRNFDNLAPAGSMTSSLRDLERWFSLFALGGALDGKRLIAAETVERMLRPRIAVEPDGIHPQRHVSRFAASFVCYGLGWYAHDFGGRRINEHTGALEGFFVLGCAVPSDRVAVVVLTNQHVSPAIHTLRYLVLSAALGLPEEDWEARFAAHSAHARREPRILDGEPYFWRPLFRDPRLAARFAPAELVGRYGHEGYGEIPIVAGGDGLAADIFGNPCALEHWHGDLWIARPRDEVIRSLYEGIALAFGIGPESRAPILRIPSIGTFARTG